MRPLREMAMHETYRGEEGTRDRRVKRDGRGTVFSFVFQVKFVFFPEVSRYEIQHIHFFIQVGYHVGLYRGKFDMLLCGWK